MSAATGNPATGEAGTLHAAAADLDAAAAAEEDRLRVESAAQAEAMAAASGERSKAAEGMATSSSTRSHCWPPKASARQRRGLPRRTANRQSTHILTGSSWHLARCCAHQTSRRETGPPPIEPLTGIIRRLSTGAAQAKAFAFHPSVSSLHRSSGSLLRRCASAVRRSIASIFTPPMVARPARASSPAARVRYPCKHQSGSTIRIAVHLCQKSSVPCCACAET